MTLAWRWLAALCVAGMLGQAAVAETAVKKSAAKAAKPVAAVVIPTPPPPPTPAPPTLVRSLGGISEYTLANGLQILLFPDDSKPTMTVNLAVVVICDALLLLLFTPNSVPCTEMATISGRSEIVEATM